MSVSLFHFVHYVSNEGMVPAALGQEDRLDDFLRSSFPLLSPGYTHME